MTTKRKFVEDALYNSTSLRVASVYVIVVNREKTHDQVAHQKIFKSNRRQTGEQFIESSDEDEVQESKITEPKVVKVNEQVPEKSKHFNVHSKKRSMYESDNNGTIATDNMNSTSASSNLPQFKKLLQDKKTNDENQQKFKSIKSKPISTGPSFKR